LGFVVGCSLFLVCFVWGWVVWLLMIIKWVGGGWGGFFVGGWGGGGERDLIVSILGSIT